MGSTVPQPATTNFEDRQGFGAKTHLCSPAMAAAAAIAGALRRCSANARGPVGRGYGEIYSLYRNDRSSLMNDNIDTDQILPKQFLKLIDKKALVSTLMYAWRYLDDNYTEDPDFVLTDLNIVKPVFSSQGITLGQVLRENTQLGL